METIMSNENAEVENYELSYSVQIDSRRMLELLVDVADTGNCVWQITNACGQVLDRSGHYEDPACCLRDGLNKALG